MVSYGHGSLNGRTHYGMKLVRKRIDSNSRLEGFFTVLVKNYKLLFSTIQYFSGGCRRGEEREREWEREWERERAQKLRSKMAGGS